MQGHCVGQCHIGPRVEAEIQLVRLMVQVGLHGEPPVGQGVLPELVIAAEPTGEFTFGAVRQMGDPARDSHAGQRCNARGVVVACAPVGVGLDRCDLDVLGRDLIGRRGCAGRHDQRAPTRWGCCTIHSRVRIPPMDPPMTAVKRSIPKASARGHFDGHLVADGDPRPA